jgi:methylphosphotriester-DNA--protein-cysteine methyltransferase
MASMRRMHYLATWRMHVATEAPQHKRVPRTGREIVGYDSEAAFSRAFKKALGVAPSYLATFEQLGHVVAKRIFNCRTIFFMV